MRPLEFAWRSLTRQPARAVLGVAGVAVVGALLFDMLMLSRGLVVSFESILDAMGFDLRVMATDSVPGTGPPLGNAAATASALAALPEIAEVVRMRFGRAVVRLTPDDTDYVGLAGTSDSRSRIWQLRDGSAEIGETKSGFPPIVVNGFVADRLELRPGAELELRGACADGRSALPWTTFEVVGIADFPFDASDAGFAVTTLEALHSTCAYEAADETDMLLITSRPDVGSAAALAAIRRRAPGLYAFSNQELVTRFEGREFSYFRQISFALTTMTLFFSFLLIATLLTVSVNQRLGEVATLRALGFARRRVVADLLWESLLLVGSGGLIALPVGALMALRLDALLHEIPGLPTNLRFFVFEPRVVLIYALLLLLNGLLAALYPVYLAARLPIAATLRRETVS